MQAQRSCLPPLLPPFLASLLPPPTLSGRLSSLLPWQESCPWMRVLPPHYLCGQQAGPARDGGGGKERPSGGGQKAHTCCSVPWSNELRETSRREHLRKGVPKVRRSPWARLGWDRGANATDAGPAVPCLFGLLRWLSWFTPHGVKETQEAASARRENLTLGLTVARPHWLPLVTGQFC